MERRRFHHEYKVVDNEENVEVEVEERHASLIKRSFKHFFKG